MRKTATRLIAIVMLVLIGSVSAMAWGDKYTIKREQLPEPAREMLATYFPGARIGMIKIDKHLLKKTDYDVKLVNGTKIEFSNKGNWTSVDCGSREVPSALIPKKIARHVADNYQGTTIVKISKSLTEYEIELSDGVEVKYTRDGRFKSVDFD